MKYFSLHFCGTVFSKKTMKVYSRRQLHSFEPNYGCPFASCLPVKVRCVIRSNVALLRATHRCFRKLIFFVSMVCNRNILGTDNEQAWKPASCENYN